MDDGQNYDAIRSDREEDGIGKTTQKSTSYVSAKEREGFRKPGDRLGGCVQGAGEFEAEAW